MTGRPQDTARRWTASVLGAVVVLTGSAVLLVGDGPEGSVLVTAVTAVGYGIAGGLLARARPSNVLGWLLLLVGAFSGASSALDVWVHAGVNAGAGRTFAAWLASWVWLPATALVPTALLLLYPSGTVTRRGRRRLVASLSGVCLLSAGVALSTWAMEDITPGVDNPVAATALSIGLSVLGLLVLVPSVLLCIVDAVQRLRHARSPEREQLAWLLITVLAFAVVPFTPWIGLRAAVQTLVPFAIAIGVVRHQLLDLQVVVRRTLLFAGLTAVVLGVFVVTTTLLSGVADAGPLPVAIAAGLVAVGLTPVRERLQRSVDRLVYGDRRDPVRAVATLGRQVAGRDDATLLQQVLTAVTAAVRSPGAAFVDEHGLVQARAGAETGGTPLRLPLQVAGRQVGQLLVLPRTARDSWTRPDRDLLEVLAQQVTVVVHVGQLNRALEQSRDNVLTATGQERGRLRQELHDGLGPALSGIALGLEAAEAALGRDTQRAATLLERLRQETQSAGTEVRRLVEGLRPAALDGEDLTAALQSFLDGLAAVTAQRMTLSLILASRLPHLPPDLEAAVYRIATEAVTNVVRHSGARTCRVTLSADERSLRLTVDDDGIGLPEQRRDGVGFDSMRRRAAELGGSWSGQAQLGGGTRVQVDLPLAHAADAARPPAQVLT